VYEIYEIEVDKGTEGTAFTGLTGDRGTGALDTNKPTSAALGVASQKSSSCCGE